MSSPSHTETDPARAARDPIVIEDDLPVDDSTLPPIDPAAYELLDEIARGGMGRILRARDRLGRIVAVKQLLEPSPHLIALFEREARITARLQHPSIVNVIEAGVLPDGQRVYVMKLVPGHSLKHELRQPKEVVDRLRLVPTIIAIADALAYAHAQGVIHRDLKPSNVLIGEFGEVVVIDWGLAHDREHRGPASPSSEPGDGASSITAKAMGTPAYMSPEAARSEAVDARTDVYAIGTILYELLAGAPPYGGDGAEILTAVRAGPPEPIGRRVPGTPPDLAAIVDKAMAYDRAHRYPSAKELAEELRRFATGQLVSAYAYSWRDRLARWVRRNRAPVAVAVAALVLTGTLTAIGVKRIIQERDLAADRAERLTLARARLELERDPAAALVALAELPPDSSSWSAARTIGADALARGVPSHARLARSIDAIAIAPSADAGVPRAVIRHDDAIEVVQLEVGGDARMVARIPAGASAVALSTDGTHVATLDDGRLRVWRLTAPAAPVFERAGPTLQVALAISHDGAVVAAGGRDTGVFAWRVADGGELARDEQLRELTQLAVTERGIAAIDGHAALVVIAGTDSRIVSSGEHPTTTRLLAVHARLAVAASGSTLRLFDGTTFGEPRAFAVTAPVTAMAISPSGTRLALASETGITVLDRDGTNLRVIAGRRRPRGIAIDDRGIVAVFERDEVWWWGVDDGRTRIETFPMVALGVGPARGEPSGATLPATVVALGDDGAVWAWDGGTRRRLGAHTAAARGVAISTDARFAVTIGDDRAVRRWSLADGATRLLGVHHGPGLAVAISPDGAAVASGGVDRLVHLWRATGETVLGRHRGAVHALAFSPDGAQLASIADDREVVVWSMDDRPARHLAHDSEVTAVAWLADGSLVTGTRAGVVTRWQGATGRTLATHRGAVRSIATHRDRVATGGDDGRVGIGDARGLELSAGHGDHVRRVRFAADGRSLASASEDGSVRLWDPRTGESRAVVLGGWVADVAFAGSSAIACGARGMFAIADPLPHDREPLRRAIADRVERQR